MAAKNLRDLLNDVERSKEVVITDEGDVERAGEARENAANETSRDGAPKPRVKLKPAPFGSDAVPSLTVAATLLDQMSAAAAEHPDRETGGVVLRDGAGMLTELIHSGPDAHRTSIRYEIDPSYLQPIVDRATDRGMEVAGIWHLHPRGFAELSATDVATARGILSDPEWGLSSLVLPLSVRARSGLDTTFWVVDSPDAKPVAAAVRITHGSRAAVPARPNGFDPLAIERRLLIDRNELERWGWKVSLRRIEARGTFAMQIERTGVTMGIEFPREYPQSPPVIAAVLGGTTFVVGPTETPERLGWSSLSSLGCLVMETEAAVQRHSRPPRRPTFINRILSASPQMLVRRLLPPVLT